MPPIPLPENLQLQSPLVMLPAEIKNIIFSKCLTASSLIVDPAIGSNRSKAEATTSNSLAFLQTCRRLSFEVDRRPLYAQNVFCFTTAKAAADFFHSVEDYCRPSIQHVEIDIRKVNSDHPQIAREWLQYLSETGVGIASKSSLRMNAPGLKTLRLNFESWPRVAMFRTDLWELLRNLLSAVKGVERVVIIGASKGSGMTKYAPWSSTHFIGGSAKYNDLIPRMWTCVKGIDDSKGIRWVRQSEKLQLEVVSMAYLQKHVDPDWSKSIIRQHDSEIWPENGVCTWDAYYNSRIRETIKGLNPSASG